MARESSWRRQCPEAVRKNQLQAMHGPPLFLLRQSGPAAFIIKDERKKKPVHVLLSDTHVCTCREFGIQKELCVHLCWVLLQKLNLKSYDALSYQLGLGSRVLATLLQGESRPLTPPQKKETFNAEESLAVPRRAITPNTSCPICLEKLLTKKLPVTHCRFSCGNAVHIRCMKVVASHQVQMLPRPAELEIYLRCPLCRGDFDTLEGLQQECRNAPSHIQPRRKNRTLLPPLEGAPPAQHADTQCSACRTSPVLGVLFRCAKCPLVLLCASCALGNAAAKLHGDHGMAFRQRPGDPWEQIPDSLLKDGANLLAELTHPAGVPVGHLSVTGKRHETLSEDLLQELPSRNITVGHKLLARGQQCCLCLNPYQVKQRFRQLPCGHQFHAGCSSDWLLKRSASCPIDGLPLRSALLLKALRRVSCNTLAQHKKRRPLSCLRSAPFGGSPTPAPSSLEMDVRQLCLVDRRGRERAPASSTSTPRYLCRTELPEQQRTTSSSEARLLRQQIFSNRAYSLPARPLGSVWRPQGGSSTGFFSIVDSRDQTEVAVCQNKGCRERQQSARADDVVLSVTSLRLPDDIGAGTTEPRESGQVEGPGIRTPRFKPRSTHSPSPQLNSRTHLNPLALRKRYLAPSRAFHCHEGSQDPDPEMAVSLSVTCTGLKLATRSPSTSATRVRKP